MKKTRKFLRDNKESLTTYGGFSDYDILLEAIENKRTADHCIEACKALIEGISKTIVLKVNLNSIEVKTLLEDQQRKNLESTVKQVNSNSAGFPVLFKQASIVLSIYHDGFEKDFLAKTGNGFCNFIGNIRNKQGDISHGRSAPKYVSSSMDLAQMVEQTTDIIALHMLEIFSLIDFSIVNENDSDKNIRESFVYKSEKRLKEIGECEILVREFNNFLDESTPLEGKLRYSLALFQQSPKDYDIQFDEYLTQKEQEEE